MLASIVMANKPQETAQGLGQNGKQSGSGPALWPDAHISTAGVESEPKSSSDYCGTRKHCNLARTCEPGRHHRKACRGEQHWDDRRSQGQCVMHWICPRRSGPSLQENG